MEDYLTNLNHPLIAEITALRNIILSADRRLEEQIKWNAPSYSLDGQDCITMRLLPPIKIQVVFHRGAKVQVQPAERMIEADFSWLKWPANDRMVATFLNGQEIREWESAFRKLVCNWIDSLAINRL